MSDQTSTPAPAKASHGGGRSVSYPFIPLEQAVVRAKTLWEKEGKNLAYASAAVKHWGYAEKSSGGKQTVAALKGFGLVDDEGVAEGRQLRLTNRALDILIDPDPDKKRKALQEAAVAPKIYGELLAKWTAHELPSDPTISAYLLREKDFNRNTVEDFIKDFRANIAYAGLANSANISSSGKPSKPDDESPSVQVGSCIQWSPGGIDQFVDPRKVTGFSDGRDFLFVEGSFTGIPVHEVTVMQTPAVPVVPPIPSPLSATPPVKPAPSGSKQDTFTLDEGMVVLQWPSSLSGDSYEDFESWIQLQLKKIKRSVAN